MLKIFAADSPHRYFLCAILLVAALNVFVRLNFLPITTLGDAPSYLNTARYLSGEEVAVQPWRLLKPLTSIGIALFAQLFDGDMILGFLTLNTLCYFLLAIAMYALLLLFTTERALAMLLTLIFISAYPALLYGLDLYSDMGAWLLFVLTLFGTVRYYRLASWKNFFLTAAAILVGLLWKEYSIPAGIFFGLIVLFEPTRTWKEKFTRIFLLGMLSAAVVGTIQWIVYEKYHYTYLDFFLLAGNIAPAISQYTFYFIIKSLIGVFFLGWGLVLLGLWNWRSIPRDDRLLLVFLFPPSVMFLLWTFVSSRLFFVLAPLLTILALHGLKATSERLRVRVFLAAFVILGSYAWLFASGTFRVFLQ